jgi:hypothetical protein
MKTKELIILIAVLIVAPVSFIFSLETKPQQPDPIELPAFVIEGVETLSIRSGIKQGAKKTDKLNQQELDSLNSLDKQSPPMVPIEALPDKIGMKNYYPGFIKGEFGRYTTALFEAGYGTKIGDYSLFGNAGLQGSQGHIDESGFMKGFLKLSSDYIAPKKFWILGGSRTRSELSLNYKSFNLYSILNPPNRSIFDARLSVDVEGNYEGYFFDAGAAYQADAMNQDADVSASENDFSGYIRIRNYWKGFLIGGNLEMNLRNSFGTSTNFFQANALGSYNTKELMLKANIGFQGAGNTMDISRGGFLLSGEVEYRLDRDITMKGNASTGLSNNSLSSVSAINPYFADTSDIDFAYDIMNLNFITIYHPSVDFSISGGAGFRVIERFLVFEPVADGTFYTRYEDATWLRIFIESSWDLDEHNRLNGTLLINSVSLTSHETDAPNIPPILLSASYFRKWTTEFGTQIGIQYNAERYADINNSKKLDAFFNIFGEIEYSFNDRIKLNLRFENLGNSNIYIWDGYKERNLYFSLGALWQF